MTGVSIGTGRRPIRYPDATVVVVSGPTGAGKTTALSQLVEQALARGVPATQIAVLFNDRTSGSYAGDITDSRFAKFQKGELVHCGCCAGYAETVAAIENNCKVGCRYIFIEVDGGSSGITLYQNLLAQRLFGKGTHYHRVPRTPNLCDLRTQLAVQEAVRVSVGDWISAESDPYRQIQAYRGDRQEPLGNLVIPDTLEFSKGFNPDPNIERRTIMVLLEIALRSGLSAEQFEQVTGGLLTCEKLLRIKALLPEVSGAGSAARPHYQWARHGDPVLKSDIREVTGGVPPAMLLRFEEYPADSLVDLFKIGRPTLPQAEKGTSADWESSFALIERMVADLQGQTEQDDDWSTYGFGSADECDSWFQGILTAYADNRLGVLSSLDSKESKTSQDWQSIANISFQMLSVALRYQSTSLITEELERQILVECHFGTNQVSIAQTLVQSLSECPSDFPLFQVKAEELAPNSDFWRQLVALDGSLRVPDFSNKLGKTQTV